MPALFVCFSSSINSFSQCYLHATDGDGASDLLTQYDYSDVSLASLQRCRAHLTYHTAYPSFSDLRCKVYHSNPDIRNRVLLVGQVMVVVSVGVVRQHGR